MVYWDGHCGEIVGTKAERRNDVVVACSGEDAVTVECHAFSVSRVATNLPVYDAAMDSRCRKVRIVDSGRSLDCLSRQVRKRPLCLVRRVSNWIFRNIYQVNNLVVGCREKTIQGGTETCHTEKIPRVTFASEYNQAWTVSMYWIKTPDTNTCVT
ncbi:hypothetical protein FGSG_12032 [Fusarium graminearum PH-1]|uniref:hypothetical protein n=1 Tax=Gibberella zeae (strain ATCC MYA-4620 / CBS 123657 / FGSC 9075 / NRRL 31084 / PH-1) TaxID=229533 RepID=UPI00021F161B|nr:hypothetical protein FGSG_12032 [Fusarium graminearum PH-1]ESU07311.1 hypothetical protein FGSG_12032 [Fusarium graminearum PH-1]|eukprot:XP_011317796.1 hypothetical protein FGSG_12032 [Fusarium graminearum PH-1]